MREQKRTKFNSNSTEYMKKKNYNKESAFITLLHGVI